MGVKKWRRNKSKKVENKRGRKEEFRELKYLCDLEKDNRCKTEKQRQDCQVKRTVKGFIPFV
ncbi:hypothetical protein [Methanosarcina sp. MTP4]|uniref:hypothetical protein n=1 Tax=Methanosarcina sp. MTP4 TaxID=1434100 RepID=UPI0012E0B19C|nr:hypothetical protein [Methanosarcina sp. MTP4]